ncbi:Ca-activated chloride channel family protein [Ochrobactrum intermedium]|uniref:Ca-activated chloride channel family protein n=3 Tax=Brucella/Ochrobactrum group TaxID=2826938 RepID=A0ABR6AJV8_9HYPH|nr:marine proteobacterial sortase target protein [Brucella intermedia]ERI16442.1 membrane protein [Ochrobactrum sp. EGD-AQ16]MBA8849742.1 Ca-activated chloride channel family protein [Brucella intermedia]MDH0123006.1 marine proteobacterial sortase target protein [Brucella intermedia GD04153]NYD81222.1 Ca-activated chloride channel family protein [Brucella intermedia]UXO84060.1 marine proteobacterial sortase target protein [Brucella intermedia]
MALLPALAVIFCLLQIVQTRAETAALVTPNEVQSGSLLLETSEAGRYVEAPRLATDVNLDVSGPTARARLTQAFENPTDSFVEALYVFPLPEESAVYSLKMVIGDRVIVADIKEKLAAREIYEKAKSEGKKATLIEQQRPNVFTNAVANIGPHEKVVIQIEYQQAVRLADERFSLRVPLVVAPRYNPDIASPVVQQVEMQNGWGKSSDAGKPDPYNAPIVTPLAPPAELPTNPVSISVELKPGFPLGKVESLYHKVRIDAANDAMREITLDGTAAADRDFVLEWSAVTNDAPQVGLFREHIGKDDYVLAYVTSPAVASAKKAQREVVFVIDNSGSMGGTSIEQAKASLDYALSHLQPGDRFNVIRFDDTLTRFFEDSVEANQQNIASARRFVTSLEAQGGTAMLPALHAALDDSHRGNGLRQIVFLTDGEISNEQQLLDAIAARRGRSRIFMVGIGSAPNSYLMNHAAELGRGTFTHIGSAAEVDERMRALFDKLENPAVTDLKANFSEKNVSMTPSILPDLYRGEPLVIAARMGKAAGNLVIEGQIDGRPWTVNLPLDQAMDADGISKLWARRKIDDAEVELTLGKISQDAADARILRLALEHHLVSRLTSLVAVDKTPSRPANTPLTRADIPLQLPAGWDYDKLFGIRAERNVEEHASMDVKGVSAPVRSHERLASPSSPSQPLPLPQTATPATLMLMQGLGSMLVGLFVLWFFRRRENV